MKRTSHTTQKHKHRKPIAKALLASITTCRHPERVPRDAPKFKRLPVCQRTGGTPDGLTPPSAAEDEVHDD
jgi:hypothetical protein